MEYGVVIVWWLTFVGLAVAGLPIAATLLDRLPDRGAGVALPLSLVVFGLPVYWIGHISFGAPAIIGGVVVLGGLAAWTARRRPSIAFDRFAEWLVVFTLAFLLIVLIRYVDPSIVPIHPGERLLDYGILNTHLRADSLPAVDPWLAEKHMRYYFGGHMLIAALSMLTTVPAKFAFNLGLAATYGALVAGAYSVAGGITAKRGGSFRHGGVLGAIFVGVSSNLAPIVQGILYLVPDGLASSIATWLAARSHLETPWLLGNIGYGPEKYFSYYWAGSRVIEGTINEFPFFAFFNGDLHAHMLSQPFLVLAIALAFAYFLTPAKRRRRRQLLLFGILPPVAGWLAITNTWSLPSAAGVGAIAAYFAPSDPQELFPRELAVRLYRRFPRDPMARRNFPPELGRFAGAGGVFLGVLALGVLWVAPFFLIPERPQGVADQPLGFVLERSGLVEFLLVHGWMLGIFAVYLWLRMEDRIEQTLGIIALSAAILMAGVALTVAAFAVVLPIAAVAWYLLRREESTVGFETALIVAGSGLVLLVEIIYLRDMAGPGRFNTVFKTYAHIWILWGIAAGASLATINTGRVPALDQDRRRRLFAILTVVLVVSTALYGAVTLGSHFNDSSVRTLDGTHAVENQRPALWEAIQFLETRSGQPTIVTAPSGPYDWGSAPSSFTGLPTVITGMHHVRSFQDPDVVGKRVTDVDRIYTGSEKTRAELLQQYNVEYIWVGPNVVQQYGYNRITVSAGPGLEPVFDNNQVTIYRVTSDKLPG